MQTISLKYIFLVKYLCIGMVLISSGLEKAYIGNSVELLLRVIILQNPSFLILSSLKEVSIRLYYQCTAENSVEQDLIILVDCSN